MSRSFMLGVDQELTGIESCKTIIVIPCYQEESRLDPGRFSEFLEAQTDTGFVFVDDGSTDATAAVIDIAVNRHPGRIAALGNETNLGKGEAVRRGVLHAAGRAEYVGYWDADLSTPLEIIPDLLAELEGRGARLVMGARVKAAGSEIVRTPWRHYPGRVFATLASLVTGRGFYDTQCGAKLFHRDIVPICFREPFLSRWCFDVEVLLRLLAAQGIDDVNTPDSAVIELPLTRWIDSGDSRLKPSDVPRMAADLARIWHRYRWHG